MRNNRIPFWLGVLFLTACVGAQDPDLLKYESDAAQTDERVVRGEISQLEADNLKMQAYQNYQAARRREEKQLLRDSSSQQIESQNQDINAVSRQLL